jgi:hypothetical protein
MIVTYDHQNIFIVQASATGVTRDDYDIMIKIFL